VGLGAVFALSYVFWPLKIVDFRSAAAFFVFLAACVGFLMLFVYDMKWRRLPEKPLFFCIACALAFVILRDWGAFTAARLFDILGGLMILPGLYFVLYKASGERLVGSGDYLLAIPLALFADGLVPAFFVLFAANLLGSVVMLPIVISRKRKKLTAQVSFGPFLIIGFFIVFFLQNYIGRLLAI
jgi:prepilin signal peptidase PulO-like enzyme (type II secretory pathway)